VSGKKISGGAAWVGSRNVLWHASILVSTDTQVLSQALSPSMTPRGTNFVRSKWQHVTTLQELVGKPVDLAAVKRELIDNCVRRLPSTLQDAQLTEKETRGMMHLFEEKYSKDDWNVHGHWKGN
jgi:lipoate-protein ligase A